MKTASYTKYGDPGVVSIIDRPSPVPKDTELLVRVIAAPVTSADARVRAARFPKGFNLLAKAAYGLTKPRKQVLGSIFSGEIISVGSEVTNFKVGDAVCGSTGIRMGTHAEYVLVKATGSVVKKPTKLSHEEVAAMIFGGTAALSFIRDKLATQKGDTILINGASGAVGTNAVQLARYYGADVTAVTSSNNAPLVTSLGAKKVIDYTKKNLTDTKEKYTVVLDTVGTLSFNSGRKLLSKNGRLGLMVASLGEIIHSIFVANVQAGVASEKPEDIRFLLSLMEQNKLQAVIDKIYSIDEIVKAHSYVDSGRKKGNVIVMM